MSILCLCLSTSRGLRVAHMAVLESSLPLLQVIRGNSIVTVEALDR